MNRHNEELSYYEIDVQTLIADIDYTEDNRKLAAYSHRKPFFNGWRAAIHQSTNILQAPFD
jgi:hypothetical protein